MTIIERASDRLALMARTRTVAIDRIEHDFPCPRRLHRFRELDRSDAGLARAVMRINVELAAKGLCAVGSYPEYRSH